MAAARWCCVRRSLEYSSHVMEERDGLESGANGALHFIYGMRKIPQCVTRDFVHISFSHVSSVVHFSCRDAAYMMVVHGKDWTLQLSIDIFGKGDGLLGWPVLVLARLLVDSCRIIPTRRRTWYCDLVDAYRTTPFVIGVVGWRSGYFLPSLVVIRRG